MTHYELKEVLLLRHPLGLARGYYTLSVEPLP